MSSIKNVNINKEEPEKDEIVRPAGFALSALIAVASLAMAKSIIDNTYKFGRSDFSWIIMISDIGCLLMLSHFILSCAVPSYLVGKPETWKIAPLAAGGALTFLAGLLLVFFEPEKTKNIYFWLEFLSPFPFVAYGFFVHLLDDAGDSALLMLKPWRRAGDDSEFTV